MRCVGFVLFLLIAFYLSFGLVPRALGNRSVPEKIEELVCGNEVKDTTVWYYGYGPEK